MKNRAIEFYKYIAACIIFILHFAKYTDWEKSTGHFNGGYLAVEFFFILSGFLMMQGMSNKESKKAEIGSSNNAINNTFNYIKSRYKRLYPAYIIAIILAVITDCVLTPDYNPIGRFPGVIPELLGLQVFIRPRTFNGPMWFVSAVIWGGALVYFLVKKFGKNITGLVFPISLICFIIWSYKYSGHVDLVPKREFLPGPFLRAFSEIAWGACLYGFAEHIKDSIKEMNRVLVGLAEIGAFAIAMYIMWGTRHSTMDYVFIIDVSILIVLAFIKHGFWSEIIDNRISGVLGGISYPIYLTQAIFQDISINCFPNHNFWIMTVINLVLVSVFAFIFQKCVDSLHNRVFNRG